MDIAEWRETGQTIAREREFCTQGAQTNSQDEALGVRDNQQQVAVDPPGLCV